MKKILVTGGAGFIGSHIAEYYSDKADVRVLDDLSTGHIDNVVGLGIKFFEGSIEKRGLVKKAVKGVSYVFHLAAMVSVPESMENPHKCLEINNRGTLTLLEEARDAGVERFVLSSSSAIYGDDPAVPKKESMLPQPKSHYAITKRDGEDYCNIFHSAGMKTVALRYFNVFGPRQDPNSKYAAAIPIFLHQALRNEPITIFGDGEQTRDFIYVKDVVAANVHLAESRCTGVYNVGYGSKITINELAKMIIRMTNSNSEIVYKKPREGDVKHSYASVDKLLKTGFSPKCNFEEGLVKTIEYFAACVK
jgi:UDP-glucose 4-epimerase